MGYSYAPDDGVHAEKERAVRSMASAASVAGAPPVMRSPAAMLAVQRTAGNRAAGKWLSQVSRRSVQRGNPPSAPPATPAPYMANPAVLGDCVNVLQQVYAMQDPATLAILRKWKTLAIGAVVDPDEPDVTILHWTANGNWNHPGITSALSSLGVRRWDGDSSKLPRGPAGAPGDAEQRLMSGDHILKALAVSRPPCLDCAPALEAYGAEHGQVLLAVVVPPHQEEETDQKAALDKIRAAADRTGHALTQTESEHAAQAALINTPSVTGFVGYWTNHLFNTDVPPPTIWTDAHGSLLRVESDLGRGDVRAATASLARARRQFLIAQRRYLSWKDNIDAAGAQAQVAIGEVAFAAIVAVVAGPVIVEAVIEALTEAAAEGAAESVEEQLATRIANTVAQGDQALLAMEARVAEAEIEAEVLTEMNELEAELGL